VPKKFANAEERAAYRKAWYDRPENKRTTIEKTTRRKYTDYAGVCINCGGKTVGLSKGQAAMWCGKPECKSAANKSHSVPSFLLSEVLALSGELAKVDGARHAALDRLRTTEARLQELEAQIEKEHAAS
jgi:hypothetical protein